MEFEAALQESDATTDQVKGEPINIEFNLEDQKLNIILPRLFQFLTPEDLYSIQKLNRQTKHLVDTFYST